MVVVATNEEYKLAKHLFKNQKILKTGVGALNVIKALRTYPKTTKILNFGYCGSNNIPIGTKCVIGTSKLYHPSVEYDEPAYDLNGDILCYTSDDFVTHTSIKTPCVFDMELAYILALGFCKVESIKIVSDNLDCSQYETTIAGNKVTERGINE